MKTVFLTGMPLYSVLLKPARENFIHTITPEEASVVAAHFNYYQELMEKRILHFAGRTNSATFGLALFSARNEKELEKLISSDPAVQSKIFQFEYDLFNIALFDAQALNSYASA